MVLPSRRFSSQILKQHIVLVAPKFCFTERWRRPCSFYGVPSLRRSPCARSGVLPLRFAGIELSDGAVWEGGFENFLKIQV